MTPREAERKGGTSYANNKKSPRAAERRSMPGKNKPMRQVETSMSKKYKGTPKVSQTTIDKIKSMGMTKALKKAGSTKNPEMLEGLRRMYGAKRVSQAMKPAVKKTAMSQKRSPRVAERSFQKRSARAAEKGM